MSNMSESGKEWELSKENIRPIQQGRKQNVLKVALAPHPENVIAQQRQAFENMLRTYSGDDPLEIWCQYINWVEQNYPKGGREGHIKRLMDSCLSVLKDDKRYFDDDRFIDILLKYANLSGKPIEIYNYMYSTKIGCKSAKFFINWSWELEQLGNMKKADEVLTQGMKHRAEPVEKLKAYLADFEIRLVNKIKENSGRSGSETDSSRSAFAVLKPQTKNAAPILRTGDAVIENRSSLVLGRQQPQPKSLSSSGRVPFKIYDAENINPSLPVQSQSAVRSSFHLENFKENEQKPVKWNKYKVKSQGLKTPNQAKPDFQLHCDDENDQEFQTPRSVPKTSSILSTHRRTPSPAMALFEPPDPLKRPMYPKNKVYGGAVEYSLEEIRAAEWMEKRRKVEQEKLLEEQQKRIEEQAKNEEMLKREIEYLAKRLELLESKVATTTTSNEAPNASVRNNETASDESGGALLNKQANTMENLEQSDNPRNNVQSRSQNLSHTQLKENADCLPSKGNPQNCSSNFTETLEKIYADSTTYYRADKLVQELYNRTLSHTEEDQSKIVESNDASRIDLKRSIQEESSDKPPFAFYHDSTDTNEISSNKFVNKNSISSLHATKQHHKAQNIAKDADNLSFMFYQDPTESITNSREVKQVESCISKERSDKLPFVLYNDPTGDLSNQNEVNQSSQTHSVSKDSHNGLPFTFFHDPTETIPNTSKTFAKNVTKEQLPLKLPHESSEEDIENVPPEGYFQDAEKRELAGILEPSKNILFIPLEQQEMSDESDGEDDYIYLNGQQHSDETLIPPSNTEQFSTAKFLASTPYVGKIKKNSDLEESNQTATSEKNNASQNVCLPSENLSAFKKVVVGNENAAGKIELSSNKEPVSSADSKSVSKLPTILSVIMETSNENYSKSSSSSSSSSLMKSNHLEQYSTQHFSLHKNFSKLETCGPGTLNSISEVSHDSSNVNIPSSSIIMHNENNAKTAEKFQLSSVDIDPFDQEVIQKLLKSTDIAKHQNICYIDKSIKTVKSGENIHIGGSMYMIESMIAEGAYAKVYKAFKPYVASGDYSTGIVALKVCKKGNEWEFYICSELQRRLSELKLLPDIRTSVMSVKSAIRYSDGIVLVDAYSGLGTLLDVVNFYKKQNSSIPELIIMYFTLEILHIVSKLHKCNIIHGDIKPDNFLLLKDNVAVTDFNQMSEIGCLKLIDFGRSVDLNFFEKGTCFTTVLSSKDMVQCNEMKDKKPWVFQLDWYGVVSCIYTMLFMEYMIITKRDGIWGIEKKFKRYWFTSLWEPLFNKLLNIPECYEEPDVLPFISMIESKLQQNKSTFLNLLIRFSGAYSQRI